jgi:hypothetical protein
VLDYWTAPHSQPQIGEPDRFAIRIHDDADVTIQPVPTILREQRVVVSRQHNGGAWQSRQGSEYLFDQLLIYSLVVKKISRYQESVGLNISGNADDCPETGYCLIREYIAPNMEV